MARKPNAAATPFKPPEGPDGVLLKERLRDFFQARYQALGGFPNQLEELTTRKGLAQVEQDLELERQAMLLREEIIDRVEFQLTDLQQQEDGRQLRLVCAESYTRYPPKSSSTAVNSGLAWHELDLVKKGRHWRVNAHQHRPIQETELPELRRQLMAPSPTRAETTGNDHGPGLIRRLLPSLVKPLLILLVLVLAIGYGAWTFGPRSEEISVSLATGSERVTHQFMGYTYKVEERQTELSRWVSQQTPQPPDEQEWQLAGGYRHGWFGDETELQEAPQVRQAREILSAIRQHGERFPRVGEVYLRRYFQVRELFHGATGSERAQARADLDVLLLDLKLK